ESGLIDPTRGRRVGPASSNHLGAGMNVGPPFRLQLRKIFHRSRVVTEKVHTADALLFIEVVIDLGDYVVDPDLVGKSVHYVDGWIIVEGKSRTVASDRTACRDRATRDFLAGRTDRDMIRQQISNRTRNTASTVTRNQRRGAVGR